jgi:hypothetical protein
MATFRCLQSGTLITFTYQHDIDSMKGHEGYVRVEEVETPVKPISQSAPVKKMGRPKKVENV